MLVSIIIPVYNVEKYIYECLRSVAEQTYKGALECIIVNDCTPDNSMSVVNGFIDTYSGNITFRIINHTQNRGLSAARNTGINAANGDYIYFLDSDDIITPDCIELLAAPLADKEYEMVVGDIVTFGDNRGCPGLGLSQGEFCGSDIIESYLKRLLFTMAVNKLCSRCFLLNNRLFFKEGILHEDELWGFVVAYNLRIMYAVNKETYRYRMHCNSIMANKGCSEHSSDSMALIYCEMLSVISKEDVENKLFYSYFDNLRMDLVWFLFDNQYNYKKAIFYRYLETNKLNPIKAYRNGFIPLKYLIRDFYLLLPKRVAYLYWRLYLKLRGNRR